MRRSALAGAAMVMAASGCARLPRLQPLTGEPIAAALPVAELPRGYHKVVFNWELHDPRFSARGEGAARIAWPDSARIDLFAAGASASTAAVLIGDSLRVAGNERARELLPAPALLWALFGRLDLGAQADTVARVNGQTLAVDVGRPVRWRATFRADSLVRLEHVQQAHVIEWVDRRDEHHVVFRDEADRRSLDLVITVNQPVAPFDASIWHLDQ